MWILHLCIQCTWSSVLAVDDAVYNGFTSAHTCSIEHPGKTFRGPEVLEFFLGKRVGTLCVLSVALTLYRAVAADGCISKCSVPSRSNLHF